MEASRLDLEGGTVYRYGGDQRVLDRIPVRATLVDAGERVFPADPIFHLGRNMVRFHSGFIWKHPAVASFEYLWRLDEGARFWCDLVSSLRSGPGRTQLPWPDYFSDCLSQDYDPFLVMKDQGKTIGLCLFFSFFRPSFRRVSADGFERSQGTAPSEPTTPT